MNEHLESEREYYKNLADDFRNEVKDMMDQPSNVATFTKEDDNEDYTDIIENFRTIRSIYSKL